MAYIERPKGFKKLVEEIVQIYTDDEKNHACWEIDRSFEREVISWREHEMLFELVSRIEL